jgi:hypothetical protein
VKRFLRSLSESAETKALLSLVDDRNSCHSKPTHHGTSSLARWYWYYARMERWRNRRLPPAPTKRDDRLDRHCQCDEFENRELLMGLVPANSRAREQQGGRTFE